jgi:arsenate reductase
VASPEQIADVLATHGELLQRPVIVREGRAIIGRPKDRVIPFLSVL